MTSEADKQRPPASDTGALVALGAAVPLGWVLHDLAVYTTSGRPALVLELLPASAAVLFAGAVFGWLGKRFGFVFLALAASAAVCFWLRARGGATSLTGNWFPRAVFFLVLAFALARAIGDHRPGRIRTGLFLGVLACAALVKWRGLRHGVELPVLLGAFAAFLVGFARSAGLRRLATAVIVAAVVLALGVRAMPSLWPTRADLPTPTVARPAGPNLLLVVLDTVRADRLALYGYERETTPELDRWVRERFTLYTSARSTSSWTLPAHASLFTGLPPSLHGAVFAGRVGRPLPDELPTLAERLREAGYRTAGIAANGAYLRSYQYHLDRGFEHYDDRLGGLVRGYIPLVQLAGVDQRPGHLAYRDARVITDLALGWLDRPRDEGRPFFLFLNYMDAHEPYLPPAGLDRAFSDEQPSDRLRPPEDMHGLLYDRELLSMDEHLGRLLHGLEERGQLEDTVVIITSDHGESLGDHDVPGHGWVLYESVVRVPLYVKPAGGRSDEVVHEDVTGADVFHLALDLLGRGVPRQEGLTGLVAELHVHSSEQPASQSSGRGTTNLVAWKEGSIKWIVSTEGTVEAYDLLVDPDELRPLVLSPEAAEDALRKAGAWWDSHPVEDPTAVERAEGDAERLKALGYE